MGTIQVVHLLHVQRTGTCYSTCMCVSCRVVSVVSRESGQSDVELASLTGAGLTQL